jgi:hypothetical protein
MKKMMLLALVLCVGISTLFVGCATVRPYNVLAPTITGVVSDATIAKVASETSVIVLDVFGGTQYPLAAEIAKKNGIKKIASIEYSVKLGFLGLWGEYTTTVSGE